MSSTVAKAIPDPPRKMLAAKPRADRKPLAVEIGQAVERAITLARMTKQDVAFRMGYRDQSALARWISGVETPQFARLWMIEELRGPLAIALAELAECCEVETVVRVKRTA